MKHNSSLYDQQQGLSMRYDRFAILILMGIIVITGIFYIPTLHWGLEKELYGYIYPIKFHLIEDKLSWICFKSTPGFIRPIFILSLYPEIWLFGYESWAFRLVNWLFHVGNILGLYALGRLLFGNSRWLLFGVAIFALQPNIVQATTVTFARGDTMAALCVLWGMWCWGKYLLSEAKQKAKIIWTFVLFILAVLTKEIAIPFPILAFTLHLTLYLQGAIRKESFKPAIWVYLTMISLIVIYWLIRLQVLGGVGGYTGSQNMGLNLYSIYNLVSVLPAAFCFVLDDRFYIQRLQLSWIISTLIASAVMLYAFRPRRRGSPYWVSAFGFLWLLLFSAGLASWNWKVNGFWHIYLPLAGFSLAIASLFREAAERFTAQKRLITALAILIILAFIPLSRLRLQEGYNHWGPRQRIFEQIRTQHQFQPDETAYVLITHNRQLLCFNVFPDMQSVKHDKYLDPTYGLVLVDKKPDGKILLGYQLRDPLLLQLNPGDHAFKVDIFSKTTQLQPIDQTGLQQEIFRIPNRF